MWHILIDAVASLPSVNYLKHLSPLIVSHSYLFSPIFVFVFSKMQGCLANDGNNKQKTTTCMQATVVLQTAVVLQTTTKNQLLLDGVLRNKLRILHIVLIYKLDRYIYQSLTASCRSSKKLGLNRPEY